MSVQTAKISAEPAQTSRNSIVRSIAALGLASGLGLSTSAHAGAPVSAAVWSELGKVSSLQANFAQVQTRKILKHPLESRGTVRFTRPASLVWSVLTPMRSTFSLDGKKATMDVPDVGVHEVIDLGAVPDANRLATSLMVWLQADATAVERDFTAEYRQSPASIRLVPKETRLAGLVNDMTLDLAESPWRVAAVHFSEPGGDVVDIVFRGVILDGKAVPDPGP